MIYRPEYYKPIEKEITDFFLDEVYSPLLKIMEQPTFNSASVLIAALRSGRVVYRNGEFSGRFNAALSKELRKYAEYDGRSKSWKVTGTVPPAVSIAAATVNQGTEEMLRRMDDEIGRLQGRITEATNRMTYGVDTLLSGVERQSKAELANLGITPDMTPEFSDRIQADFNERMNANIKNFTPEQTDRLRELVRRGLVQSMGREELRQALMAEFNSSAYKARFWARQETQLLFSAARNARYEDAGVKYYRWATAGDERVVGTPGGLYPRGSKGHGNHHAMNNKICNLDDPTVYADNIEAAQRGAWKSKAAIGGDDKHPGEAFMCRCIMIPVVI